jgi:hypothetical protein
MISVETKIWSMLEASTHPCLAFATPTSGRLGTGYGHEGVAQEDPTRRPKQRRRRMSRKMGHPSRSWGAPMLRGL